MLLLDTHVLIWTLEGDARRIGRKTRTLISRAESQDAIRISPVTLFEMAALHTSGRIRLAAPLDDWLDDALSGGRLRVTELTPRAAISAGAIPRDALSDPLDRLLVASAAHSGATFLTCDEEILAYASRGRGFLAHDASR